MMTPKELEQLERSTSYFELAQIAMAHLANYPRPIVEVCGPITTGGLGSIEKNLEVFSLAVQFLKNQGKTVFDQLPFQNAMVRLKEKYEARDGYTMSILEDFYQPIFESGIIDEMHFLPDWQTSKGATWEHAQAEKLGIKIFYFSAAWTEKLVS
jgi:hypothetical protein